MEKVSNLVAVYTVLRLYYTRITILYRLYVILGMIEENSKKN